jgi:hypothetical protein
MLEQTRRWSATRKIWPQFSFAGFMSEGESPPFSLQSINPPKKLWTMTVIDLILLTANGSCTTNQSLFVLVDTATEGAQDILQKDIIVHDLTGRTPHPKT